MRTSLLRLLRAALVAVPCLLAAVHGPSLAGGQALDEGVDMPRDFVTLDAHPILEAARQLLLKKQYAEVIDKLRELDGVAGKSSFDEYVMLRLAAASYMKLGNAAAIEPTLQKLLASKHLQADEKAGYQAALASERMRREDFAGVISLLWNNPMVATEPELSYMLAHAYWRTDKRSEAGKQLMQMMQALDKKNAVPEENDLKLMAYYCQEAKNLVCVTDALERQMRHYPSTALREQLVQRLAGPGMPAEVRLEAMRLQFATKRLRPSQYADFVRLLIQQGSPAEAAKVMGAGVPGEATTDKQYREKVTAQIKTARASGKTSGYDKLFSDSPAVAMDAILTEMSVALPADLPILTLHLALAQQAAGEHKEAAATFKSVSGYPSAEKLSRLWLDHFTPKLSNLPAPATPATRAK